MDVPQRSTLNREMSAKLVSWLQQQPGFAEVTIANDDRGSHITAHFTDGTVRSFLVADRPPSQLAGMNELKMIDPDLVVLESAEVDAYVGGH